MLSCLFIFFLTSLRKSEVNCLLPARSTACGGMPSDSILTLGLGQGKLISQGEATDTIHIRGVRYM